MIKDQVLDWIIVHKKWVFGAWILLVGVGLAVLVWQGGFLEETKVEVISTQTTSVEVVKTIWVDVSGEVIKPGVYSLESGDRVVDATDKAGGLSKEADLEWVEKNLNKAAKLTDGQKIYIPKKSEILSTKSQINTDNQNLKININTAGQSELESLPGVGPVTATKIINARPFADTAELLSKKIVAQKVYGEIKDLVSVW